MFPGRRGAGRIFHTEVKLSGVVPQVCVLFGPSAAGGAYIPAFCDVVIMREGNASMYLGSPRMAEMVIGEKVTLEEMGGAKMHTGVSGCGHFLVKSDEDGIDLAKRYLSYFPTNWQEQPPAGAARGARERAAARSPPTRTSRSTCTTLLDSLVDADSFLEVQKRWAKELIVGYARIEGRVVGHRREPAEAARRRPVRRLVRQGRALHLDLQRVQRPAAVPRRRAGLHDRHAGRAPGHHPRGREDDLGGLGGDGAEAVGDRPQGVRRRPLRDGRPGVRPRRVHRAAGREDRGDGAAGGDQRGLLQPAPGDRGRRGARAPHRGAARRVQRGDRHPPPRVRARVDAVVQPEDLRARARDAASPPTRRATRSAGRTKRNPVTPV